MTGREVASGELMESKQVICNQAAQHDCPDWCQHKQAHPAYPVVNYIDPTVYVCSSIERDCQQYDFLNCSRIKCRCVPVKDRPAQKRKSGCLFIASGEKEGRPVTGTIIGDRLINADMHTLATLENYACELCGAKPVWAIDGSGGRYQAVNICAGCLRKMVDYLEEIGG